MKRRTAIKQLGIAGALALAIPKQSLAATLPVTVRAGLYPNGFVPFASTKTVTVGERYAYQINTAADGISQLFISLDYRLDWFTIGGPNCAGAKFTNGAANDLVQLCKPVSGASTVWIWVTVNSYAIGNKAPILVTASYRDQTAQSNVLVAGASTTFGYNPVKPFGYNPIKKTR